MGGACQGFAFVVFGFFTKELPLLPEVVLEKI
jgi:hypothetical protein